MITIAPYTGPVTQCTVLGCDGVPKYVTSNGGTGPGECQVACRSHIGDVAGNLAKREVNA